MCDHSCFKCPFDDCIIDDYVSAEDRIMQNDFDRGILPISDSDRKTLKRFDVYNHSEKGKLRAGKYEGGEKGRERQKNYAKSEKGRARDKRYYERKKAAKEAERSLSAVI